jgi:hypothetical protein
MATISLRKPAKIMEQVTVQHCLVLHKLNGHTKSDRFKLL